MLHQESYFKAIGTISFCCCCKKNENFQHSTDLFVWALFCNAWKPFCQRFVFKTSLWHFLQDEDR